MQYSFLFASRNDDYEGNSPERLAATLFALVQQLARRPALEARSEIVLVDWNSDVPLRDNPLLDRIAGFRTPVRIVEVPKELADSVAPDVPLSEVHALNLGAKEARGQFLMRLDQDTITGAMFLNLLERLLTQDRWLLNTIWWVGRREIPREDYGAVISNPNAFVQKNWARIPYWASYQRHSRDGFGATGTLGMLKRTWLESGGYDESMRMRSHMEIEFTRRLAARHYLWNLHDDYGTDFYHIWHTYNSGRPTNELYDVDDERRAAAKSDLKGYVVWTYKAK